MRILLVEDDAALGEATRKSLQKENYAVDWVSEGERALSAIDAAPYDLIILDLGLPRMSGLAMLRVLRARNDPKATTPVLITTARDAVSDRVEGLDAGADDYLVKPFAISELHARVRALIRRRNAAASSELVHGRLRFDQVSRQARADDQPLDLSAREAGILEVLLLRAGRAVSKEQLLESLCAWDQDISLNAIEVYVHRLRKKLEVAEIEIRTFRGLGYCIDKPSGERS
ncbi:MAG: response regulator [Casimicrobiaceae bacterium]|nr:response regulator [Casimicrobiaceae bacterium]MCX8097626.1 response regulator [Casimicrobiaceae bacterium]MDW8312227.1 response regulator [Burkholderiales bacterium]